MRRFMTLLMILIVGVMTTSGVAASGVYYDQERSGEGIFLFQNEDNILFSFFTYIERCNHRFFADELFIKDEFYRPCRKQQAWYLTGAVPITGGQSIGVLYSANPMEIDEGIETLLGEVIDVGLFVLTEVEGGFNMIVLQTGDALSPDADIYHRTFKFRTLLYAPTVNPLNTE